MLPNQTGLGFKPQHYSDILQTKPRLGFLEIHAENYMVDGGPFHHFLGLIREQYPLSLHGVGLSIGAEGPLDQQHLKRLAALIQRYQPQSFSEHLAWSSHGGVFFNDLLPLPYNGPTLQRVCDHIHQVQNRLGRSLLLENPSTYVAFASSTWSEGDFLREVVQRTGCGLLLDVNNVYVSSTNHGLDPLRSLCEQTYPGDIEMIPVVDGAAADTVFELLMGNDVAPRRDFIIDSADSFERDRIDA